MHYENKFRINLHSDAQKQLIKLAQWRIWVFINTSVLITKCNKELWDYDAVTQLLFFFKYII